MEAAFLLVCIPGAEIFVVGYAQDTPPMHTCVKTNRQLGGNKMEIHQWSFPQDEEAWSEDWGLESAFNCVCFMVPMGRGANIGAGKHGWQRRPVAACVRLRHQIRQFGSLAKGQRTSVQSSL